MSRSPWTLRCGMLAATLLAGSEVSAQTPAASLANSAEAQALSDKYFCSACHANERTLVGPGLVAIATKYKGDAAGQAALAAKVRNGGQGVWGAIPMPPNPGVSDDELKQLLAWILSLE